MARRSNLRLLLAVAGCKAATAASRAVGRDGTLLPGSIARRIYPELLDALQAPQKTVYVTGTNGKTTTTNLLDDILEDNGFDIVDNRAGGNITEGITAAFTCNSRLNGTPKKDMSVLEIDEHHTRLVFPAMHPDMVVVTNLYRDSFVRNANPEYVMGVMDRSIPKDTHLILNADDCLSSQLGNGRDNVTYFSVARLPKAKSAAGWVANDIPDCPKCGAELVFDYCHLRHVGHAHCPECGYENPKADYEVISVNAEEECAGSFVMRENKQPGAPTYEYHISSFTTSALYNLTAAIVAARELGLAPESIIQTLNKGINVIASRYQDDEVGGKKLIEVLAKGWNPSACSSVMSMIHDAPGKKAVVLIIDDFRAESSVEASDYMGWLYASDLEQLADDSIVQILVAGSRAKDYELRLILAGVKPEVITIVDDHYQLGDAVRINDVDRVYWAYDWEADDVIKKTHARVAQRIREGM